LSSLGVWRRLMLAAPLGFALMWGSAQAREITAAERVDLNKAVEVFAAAMRAGDMQAIIDAIPPRILPSVAKSHGIDPAALRLQMIEQFSQAMKAVKIVSFKFDLSSAKFRELPGGAPYALIPTETVVDAGQGKVQVSSDTLALLEDGHWYLARVEQPGQVQMLTQAYPEFASVTFGGATTKVVP